jgi:hypothetical protein
MNGFRASSECKAVIHESLNICCSWRNIGFNKSAHSVENHTVHDIVWLMEIGPFNSSAQWFISIRNPWGYHDDDKYSGVAGYVSLTRRMRLGLALPMPGDRRIVSDRRWVKNTSDSSCISHQRPTEFRLRASFWFRDPIKSHLGPAIFTQYCMLFPNPSVKKLSSVTFYWIVCVILYFYFRSWGSSVSIVSGYRLDKRSSIFGRGKEFFL